MKLKDSFIIQYYAEHQARKELLEMIGKQYTPPNESMESLFKKQGFSDERIEEEIKIINRINYGLSHERNTGKKTSLFKFLFKEVEKKKKELLELVEFQLQVKAGVYED